MKRIILAILPLLFATATLAQQRGGDPEARLERMNENMKEELSLSDDQYVKVKVLNEELMNNMMALRETGDREAMKQVRDDYMAALDEILTDGQMQKQRKIMDERKQKRGEKKKGRKRE